MASFPLATGSVLPNMNNAILSEKEESWYSVGHGENAIFILRTEKSYIKHDGINYSGVLDLETQIERLKNHYLIDDNIFIDDIIQLKYPNSNYVLTNTIHQWNELLSIRWYYEFKNIFKKLNQPYDLCFSIRYHKRHRKDYRCC